LEEIIRHEPSSRIFEYIASKVTDLFTTDFIIGETVRVGVCLAISVSAYSEEEEPNEHVRFSDKLSPPGLTDGKNHNSDTLSTGTLPSECGYSIEELMIQDDTTDSKLPKNAVGTRLGGSPSMEQSWVPSKCTKFLEINEEANLSPPTKIRQPLVSWSLN
jgi:hypothetical protein